MLQTFQPPHPPNPKLLPLKWMKTLMAGMKGRKATQANPSASLRCRPHIIYNFPTPSATTLTLIARLIYWMKTVTAWFNILLFFYTYCTAHRRIELGAYCWGKVYFCLSENLYRKYACNFFFRKFFHRIFPDCLPGRSKQSPLTKYKYKCKYKYEY